MGQSNKKNTKGNPLIPILLIVTIIAVGVSIWAMFFRDSGPTLAPDYAPQEEEQYAEEIPNDDGEKMEQPQGGGSVSLSYSREVTVDLSDKLAGLYFANPGKSNQDILLQIVIQDQVIVQSGTLKPGNRVTSLELLDNAAGMLAAGGYEGKFVVFYYDPVTAEKAVVNTEIPVTITVTE